MPLTFSHSKLYRHLAGFLLSLWYVFFPILSWAGSELSLAGSNSWILKELGSSAITSAATADANMVVGIAGGGSTSGSFALGARGIALTAAGLTSLGFGAAAINSLLSTASTNQCIASPSTSGCSSPNSGGFNVLTSTGRSIPLLFNGQYTAGTGTPHVSTNARCGAGGYGVIKLTGAPDGYCSYPGESIISISPISLTNSVLSGTALATAANNLTQSDYDSNGIISSPIRYPGSSTPTITITAPAGTPVYSPGSPTATIVPSTGSLTVPNPAYDSNSALAAAAASAGQAAFDDAIAAGYTPAQAETARAIAVSAYATARASGQSDSQALASAKAAASKAASGTSTKTESTVSLKDEDLPAINLPDTCPDCTNKLGDENFFTHAKDVLSNKFPFDVIGDSTQFSSLSSTCPSVTFWGKAQEICAARTVVVAIKYPVGFSWLIYLITHL